MSNSETLKDIAEDQKTFLDEAYGVFRSKTYSNFIFVEGFMDKAFLKKKGFIENEFFYLGMCGKDMVKSSQENFKKIPPYTKISKIAFLIDNDYDHVTNIVNNEINLFTHSVCNNTKKHYFNDLECYLVNSCALVDWLDEFGLKPNQISLLKQEVERESRRVGKYRAANELLKKRKSLPKKSTILCKFEIEEFFDHKTFLFLERAFESKIKLSSSYRNLTNELFALSAHLDNQYSAPWQLSRGHDVTELISLYLLNKFSINLSAEEIEQYLRLSIDTSELNTYQTYKDLKAFFGM